jgi:hypothetical protein
MGLLAEDWYRSLKESFWGGLTSGVSICLWLQGSDRDAATWELEDRAVRGSPREEKHQQGRSVLREKRGMI